MFGGTVKTGKGKIWMWDVPMCGEHRNRNRKHHRPPLKTQNTLLGSKLKSRSKSQQLPGKTANFSEFFHQTFGVLTSIFSKGTCKQCLGTITRTLWRHGCLLYSREAFVRLLLWPCQWPKVYWGAGARWDNQARQRSPLHTWKVGAHNCLWGNQMVSLLCTAVISSVLLQTEWELHRRTRWGFTEAFRSESLHSRCC